MNRLRNQLPKKNTALKPQNQKRVFTVLCTGTLQYRYTGILVRQHIDFTQDVESKTVKQENK